MSWSERWRCCEERTRRYRCDWSESTCRLLLLLLLLCCKGTLTRVHLLHFATLFVLGRLRSDKDTSGPLLGQSCRHCSSQASRPTREVTRRKREIARTCRHLGSERGQGRSIVSVTILHPCSNNHLNTSNRFLLFFQVEDLTLQVDQKLKEEPRNSKELEGLNRKMLE